MCVLGDALAMSGLGQDDEVVLHAPAQQHLSGSSSYTCSDTTDRLVRQVPSGSEWTVGLGDDVASVCGFEQTSPVLERAELHLVDDGRIARDRKDGVELLDTEVRYADRPRVPQFLGPLHARPRPGRTALRPVNDVEVDVVDAQALQALLRLDHRVLAAWVELGRDEHVLARDTAF